MTTSSTQTSAPVERATNQCGTTNQAARDHWLGRILADLPRGSRILDAGAGESRYRPLCDHLEYVSQDVAQYDGRGDGQALHTGTWDCSDVDIVSDIADIPEPDGSFDTVMCTEVIEHVPDPIGALREIVRLLKPGGTIILTAPFCALTHFSPHFYYTGFSRHFYEHWLPRMGIVIDELTWNGNYFEYLGQELRRVSAIGQQYADTKPTRQERTAVHTVLRLLNALSEKDADSKQLLAFGLHVLGHKR